LEASQWRIPGIDGTLLAYLAYSELGSPLR
jgi:hypothetical protein